MEFRNITEFRAQAENCFQQSELTKDSASKLYWLTLAEAWLLLADNLGKRDVYDSCGLSVYHVPVQRQDARHLPRCT
jgi:hypothetical protein